MHKQWLNFARLHLTLSPRGPLLIKSGLETPDPTRPSMEFVRTRHAQMGETVYLPGTSLKGALRHHAERLVRGQGTNACDPLRSQCRGEGKGEHTPAVFLQQCPICRTFGSLKVAGRTQIFDAYPWPAGDGEPAADPARAQTAPDLANANATETRWQVGIDRETGKTKQGALYDLEVVTQGGFHSEIQLRDFQLWQLGLLVAVLRDVDAGLVPLGFGKSRGLGQVKVEWQRLEFEAAGPPGAPELRGAGRLAADPAVYGLFCPTTDHLPLPSELTLEPTWRGHSLVANKGDALTALRNSLVSGPLVEALKAMPRDPGVKSVQGGPR